jgi:hypothetical protein
MGDQERQCRSRANHWSVRDIVLNAVLARIHRAPIAGHDDMIRMRESDKTVATRDGSARLRLC